VEEYGDENQHRKEGRVLRKKEGTHMRRISGDAQIYCKASSTPRVLPMAVSGSGKRARGQRSKKGKVDARARGQTERKSSN